MTHLSRDQLLDAAEGRGQHGDHLSRCAACRAEIEALAQALAAAASVDVPEPSPLFWDRFSARVATAVREDAAARAQRNGAWLRPWRRSAWRVLAPMAAALAVVLAVMVVTTRRPVSRGALGSGSAGAPPAAAAVAQADTALGPSTEAVVDMTSSGDEGFWDVFSAVAAEMDPSGLTLGGESPASSADGAVLQLSDEEQWELIRLLKDEMLRAAGAATEG